MTERIDVSSTSDGDVAVALSSLRKTFMVRRNQTVAVHDASFVARRGQITAVLGPNGAGKTTTLECVSGQQRPTSGSVTVLGQDPQRFDRDHAARIGVMLQAGGVPPSARVGELLETHALFYATPRDPVALAARCGLDQLLDRSTRRLSQGERARLSLALAIIGRPEVVILDEPTAGMDIAGRDLTHALVRELRAEGVAILISTHRLDEAQTLSDHVVIMDKGRVVVDAPTDHLLSQNHQSVQFSTRDAVDVAALEMALGAVVKQRGTSDYEVLCAPTPGVVAQITGELAAQNVLLGELHAGHRDLEAIFVDTTMADHTVEVA